MVFSCGPRIDWDGVWGLLKLLVIVAVVIGHALLTRQPREPQLTIYPECDMQVALTKELQRRVKALEDFRMPEPPPFPPAKKPERSILIDPNSRIIGGEKTSMNYRGCNCLRVAGNRP